MNPVVKVKGWRARLERAIEHGVDDREMEEMIDAASTWDTCAVGENAEMLKEKGYPFRTYEDDPTYHYPIRYLRPTDIAYNPVNELGVSFMTCIEKKDWAEALVILTKIENLPSRRPVEEGA